MTPMRVAASSAMFRDPQEVVNAPCRCADSAYSYINNQQDVALTCAKFSGTILRDAAEIFIVIVRGVFGLPKRARRL
jgi:hypothetical protein